MGRNAAGSGVILSAKEKSSQECSDKALALCQSGLPGRAVYPAGKLPLSFSCSTWFECWGQVAISLYVHGVWRGDECHFPTISGEKVWYPDHYF